jgi:hypothetical protein
LPKYSHDHSTIDISLRVKNELLLHQPISMVIG